MAGNLGECLHSPLCIQDKEAQRGVFIAPVPLLLTATIYLWEAQISLSLGPSERASWRREQLHRGVSPRKA